MIAKIRLIFPLILLAIVSLPSPVHAQLVWNTNGVGGSGTWDATTANWYHVPSFSNVVWNSGAAHFTGMPGTVTLNSSLNATGLRFNISGYTISGSGTLTLTGGLPGILSAVQTGSATHDINVPMIAAGRVSIASPLSGPTSVTFNLGANNAFTNGIQLTGPNVRLNLNAPQALGTGPDAGPIFVETSLIRISNLENAAPLTVTIPNELILNATNQSGTFQTVMGTTAPALSPTSPVTQSALVFSGVISGNSDIIISNSVTGGGGGTTVFANSMTYTGKTILNHSAESGVFQLGMTNALPSGTHVVFGNGSANFAVGLFDLNGFNL